MHNLILRFPALEDKDEWLDYYQEFLENDLNSDPLNYSKYKTYEDFLIGIGKEECLIKSTSKTVPTSSFLLIANNRIIGHIFIHHINDLNLLRDYEGNIGYAIRPTERNKGYGTEMLRLALKECQNLNLKEVLISCDRENIPSSKVIENNNGKLLKEVFIPEENIIFKKYKIKL